MSAPQVPVVALLPGPLPAPHGNGVSPRALASLGSARPRSRPGRSLAPGPAYRNGADADVPSRAVPLWARWDMVECEAAARPNSSIISECYRLPPLAARPPARSVVHWLGYSTCAGNVRAGAGSACAGNVCASATALPRPSGRGSPLRSGCGTVGRCSAMRSPQGAHAPIASPSVALPHGAGGDCALLGGRAILGARGAVCVAL